MPKTGLGGEVPLNTNESGHDGMAKLRMLNMYIEPTPQGPGKIGRFPRPGLRLYKELGEGPIRARFNWGKNEIVVSGIQVFFNDKHVGDVPGTDSVRFAFSDEELVIVSNNRAYYVTSDGVSLINDQDMPEDIGDVAFLAGKFVYTDLNSSKFVWSNTGDAKHVDGLAFATSAENTAEVIKRVIVLVDQLIFFLDTTTEWWYATGNTDAPYSRSQGRKYDKGLAAKDTLVFPLDNSGFFLGNDRIVYRAEAIPSRKSTTTIERKLQKLTEEEIKKCHAFGVVFSGHTFYVLTTPYETWAFDVFTSMWSPWSSYNSSTFRIKNTYPRDLKFMGDSHTGKIYYFDANAKTDENDPIEKIVSGFVRQLSSKITNFNVTLECQRGDYDPNEEAVIEMRFSDDDCSSWSNPCNAMLGTSGGKTRAVWWGLGAISPPGRYYEFRCSSPINFAPYSMLFNTYL